MPKPTLRIHKLIARFSNYSLRKAESLVVAGLVSVNDKKAEIGQKVSFDDEIKIKDQVLKLDALKFHYYLLNKPKGTISSRFDPQKRQTVITLVKTKSKIYPVGRLDYDSSGALILTNDGALSHCLMHPKFEVPKIYWVRLKRLLSEQELATLNATKKIANQVSYHQVQYLQAKTYEVKLHQGQKHHVKKIFALVNEKVLSLHRYQYAFLKVNDLDFGEYRLLSAKEIKALYNFCNQN